MMTSAPRTSTPVSCKPMRMPSSQATPATPPPPRTSARVLVSFDFIMRPPKKQHVSITRRRHHRIIPRRYFFLILSPHALVFDSQQMDHPHIWGRLLA